MTDEAEDSWRKGEMAYLRRNADTQTPAEIGVALNRTEAEVRARIAMLSASEGREVGARVWSEGEDALLAKLREEGVTFMRMVSHFDDRTLASIRRRISILKQKGYFDDSTS